MNLIFEFSGNPSMYKRGFDGIRRMVIFSGDLNGSFIFSMSGALLYLPILKDCNESERGKANYKYNAIMMRIEPHLRKEIEKKHKNGSLGDSFEINYTAENNPF